MIDESMRILVAMESACRAIHEYQSSDLSRHVDDMLTNLIDSYRADLAEINEGDLKTLQAKLKQTIAIRAVIRGESVLPRA